MATSGPGRRSPKTWTLPSASRTRRVPWRMKRRSRLDNKRTWQSSVVAASLCSNVPERGHAAPDEAALNDLTESNFAHHLGPLMEWTGCSPRGLWLRCNIGRVLAAIVLENLR